jgi:hypothetical protein
MVYRSDSFARRWESGRYFRVPAGVSARLVQHRCWVSPASCDICDGSNWRIAAGSHANMPAPPRRQSVPVARCERMGGRFFEGFGHAVRYIRRNGQRPQWSTKFASPAEIQDWGSSPYYHNSCQSAGSVRGVEGSDSGSPGGFRLLARAHLSTSQAGAC